MARADLADVRRHRRLGGRAARRRGARTTVPSVGSTGRPPDRHWPPACQRALAAPRPGGVDHHEHLPDRVVRRGRDHGQRGRAGAVPPVARISTVRLHRRSLRRDTGGGVLPPTSPVVRRGRGRRAAHRFDLGTHRLRRPPGGRGRRTGVRPDARPARCPLRGTGARAGGCGVLLGRVAARAGAGRAHRLHRCLPRRTRWHRPSRVPSRGPGSDRSAGACGLGRPRQRGSHRRGAGRRTPSLGQGGRPPPTLAHVVGGRCRDSRLGRRA